MDRPKKTYSFPDQYTTTNIDPARPDPDYQAMLDIIYQRQLAFYQRILQALDDLYPDLDDEALELEPPDINPKDLQVTPHIITDPSSDSFQIITPFHKVYLRHFKSQVPERDRSYNFTTKIWSVKKSKENLDKVKHLIQAHFDVRPQIFTKEGDLHATHDTAIDVTSKYRILGVSPSATQGEIKRAYYAIAKRLHPDVSDADKEFFELATKAYNTLKDPKKRRRYDVARKVMRVETADGIEEITGLKLTSRDLA